MPYPNLVAAADWGTRWEKRWMARASWSGETYSLSHPVPVGEARTLLERLLTLGGNEGTVLVGFDFPIGLPEAFVKARFPGQDFQTILQALPKSFFCPSDEPSLAQPFGPNSSAAGALGPDRLAQRLLGLDKAAILRICDIQAEAHPMFHTLGPRQVGRAAAQGWSEVLQPGLKRAVRFWPFDGPLTDLLEKPGVVVAEIYPALFYRRLPGVVSALKGQGKETAAARSTTFRELLRVAQEDGAKLTLTDTAQEWVEAGFASSDDFDALSGVVGMLRALAKGDRIEPPDGEVVRRVEGWMLGLA